METMRVLVTGGAGFIGSHLVARLLKDGHEAVVLDNLFSGKKERVPKEVKFISGDVRDQEDVRRAAADMDIVFHLAALADARKDEDLIYDVNFLGSKNVFESTSNVVFASSAAVYGNLGICKEGDECNPLSQYGKSKLRAEKILENGFILRLFNVYGPNGHGVINKFCTKIPKYEDITVFGTGLQTRDYIDVRDVVDALMLGIDNTGLFNVGTGQETNLLNVIDIIHAIAKAKPSVKFAKENPQEIRRSKADITKIKKELGWVPKIKLQDGIYSLLESTGNLPENIYK